jgi:hypothetical protein
MAKVHGVVERLWRSVKYEKNLRAYDSVAEARPIKLTSPRCPSACQPNQAHAPLIDAEKLFRQPRPVNTLTFARAGATLGSGVQ